MVSTADRFKPSGPDLGSSISELSKDPGVGHSQPLIAPKLNVAIKKEFILRLPIAYFETRSAGIARRTAAIGAAEGRRDGRSTPAATIAWRDGVPDKVRRREEATLEAEMAGLDASVASLRAEVKQQEAERAKAVASIASETALIAILSERVDMRSELAAKKDVSRAQVLDALQQLRQSQTSLVSLQGGLAGTAAAIEAAEAQIRKTVEGFIADNADARELAEMKVGDLVEQVEKARVNLADMTLTAPTSGTVQAMAVTTLGQVVTTGQELLTVVPVSSTRTPAS